MEKPKRVFISHASEDKDRFVLDFAKQLRVKGIDAWIDKWEMNPGDKLVDKIFNEGFNDVDAFIIVLSQFSIIKKWVKEELETAVVQRIEKNTKLIPVIIDKNIKIPEVLKSTIWMEIKDLNQYENDLNLIVNSIYGIYNKPPLGTPPKHITKEIYPIEGLTKIDTIILKEICKIAMEQNYNQIQLVYISEKVENTYNITKTELYESLNILYSMNLVKCLKSLNTIISVDVLFSGLNKYAKDYLPNYNQNILEIATYLLNNFDKTAIDSKTISDALNVNEYLIKHILEYLKRKSMINIFKTINITRVYKINPILKRFVENNR